MKTEFLHHSHNPVDIAIRLAKGTKHSYLRDWIYGGIDGSVTTFAVISGVAGAQLPISTLLILGSANLGADGFSMAASNYLGTKSEEEELRRLRAHEFQEIRKIPEGEREEIRQILLKKGFTGEALNHAIETITSDPERWVEMMINDEYGLSSTVRSPGKSALFTFIAFVICGSIPLLPFIFRLDEPFLISSIATCTNFFLIGVLKSRRSLISWWKSGLQSLLVGGSAALIAYFAGKILSGLG